jgi:hypothetical protein
MVKPRLLQSGEGQRLTFALQNCCKSALAQADYWNSPDIQQLLESSSENSSMLLILGCRACPVFSFLGTASEAGHVA